MRWLAALLPLCAADVALVDIRGTGTPNEAILKQQLASTYGTAGIPGAGELLPTSDITLNTAISGSYLNASIKFSRDLTNCSSLPFSSCSCARLILMSAAHGNSSSAFL